MSDARGFRYRTALEGALTQEKLIEHLNDIHKSAQDAPTDYEEGSHITFEIRTKVEEIFEHIEKLGFEVEEYEDKISDLRALIEEAYEFMTLNTFKQKVPRETLEKFKRVMGEVTTIVRANKNDRNRTNTD